MTVKFKYNYVNREDEATAKVIHSALGWPPQRLKYPKPVSQQINSLNSILHLPPLFVCFALQKHTHLVLHTLICVYIVNKN